MAEVHGHVCDSKHVSISGGNGVFGWQSALCWHQAATPGWWILSLPTNQPFMILHLQMQNTPIIDAVIKWCFNLACLWLERKQPIHLTNEVISAIGWPCRFTYGHYTVCEALSELCWPCHEGGWKSEWIRWISNPSNPNLAWPVLKSVKIRHKIDRKEYLFAILCSLTFLGITLNLAPSFRFLCQCRIKWDLDKIKDDSG